MRRRAVLGRSIFGILDKNLVVHALDKIRHRLAQARLGLGETDVALKELDQAIALDPNNGEAWGLMAMALRNAVEHSPSNQTAVCFIHLASSRSG